MKNLELIEKSLKKNSTQQLFAKLAKLNQNSQEYDVIVSILEKRGNDVSNWKNESDNVSDMILDTVDESWADDGSDLKEEVEKKELSLRDKLIEEVDQFVDKLIKSKRTGVYTEVMRSLGGQYDSDLDELFENVSEDQLKDALSFKNLKSKQEMNKVDSLIVKGKELKNKESKKEQSIHVNKISKSQNTEKREFVVEFTVAKNSKKAPNETLRGKVVKDFICDKVKKRFFKIKTDKGLFLKRADLCKEI